MGITEDVKVQPIQSGELLRLNIGTAPVLGKVNKIKSKTIEIELRRPACIFEGRVMWQLAEELLRDGD